MSTKAIVIGSGFAGISAATCLASKGWEVIVLEKNSSPGGRARSFNEEGFTFDMGPSWYWMPDVFEAYFQRFGKSVTDYYNLIRLNPSYRVFFEESTLDIPADINVFGALLESMEKGSQQKLTEFLDQASYKYKVGIERLVYKPGQSLTEFADKELIRGLFKLDVFTSMHKHLRKYFKDERILKLMEFPVLFLGATPEKTPALYSLMNYADICLGTWYPEGGMIKIVDGMVALAQELGVQFHYNQEVKSFEFLNNKITSVNTSKNVYQTDVVVAGADYHHIDQNVLPKDKQNYSESYWNNRTLAPSSLIFYLGINKKLKNLEHHNLFFDKDFKKHAEEIYEHPQWPSDPLFYVSCTSKTDETVAPPACENLFILIPVAPGLTDKEETRERYFDLILKRLEKHSGQSIREHIVYKRSYAHSNFIADYNAFKGNAYGLANTLKQTAILKPSIRNKRVKNLYFTGQLTVPGPGVPPSLISGQVVADEVCKEFEYKNSVLSFNP